MLVLLIFIWALTITWDIFSGYFVFYFSFFNLQFFAPLNELTLYFNLNVIQLWFYGFYFLYISVLILGCLNCLPQFVISFLFTVFSSLTSSNNFLVKLGFFLGLRILFLYLVVVKLFIIFIFLYFIIIFFETFFNNSVEDFLPLVLALNELEGGAFRPVVDSEEIIKALDRPRISHFSDGLLELKNLPAAHTLSGHLKYYDLTIDLKQADQLEGWRWIICKYHHPKYIFWQVTQYISFLDIPKSDTILVIKKVLTSNLSSLELPQVHPLLWGAAWEALIETKKEIHGLQLIHIEHAFGHDITLTGDSKILVFPPTYILIFLNDSGHIRLAYARNFSLNSELGGSPIVIEEFASRLEAEKFLLEFASRLRDESIDFSRFVPSNI